MMIPLSANAEDYLESLYMQEVEGDAACIPTHDDRVVGELLRNALVQYTDSRVTLTKQGTQEARGAVRRHRLAERLFHDVIAVHGAQVDRSACEVEHSLHHGLDEQICTLLGHPTTCPHGRPIPPGRCCKEGKAAADAAVSPLAVMKGGQRGVVAYLASKQPETVQKLMALGALPGAPVAVIQTFPSVVFQVNQTQIAIDVALAEDIYVRRINGLG